MFKRFSPRTKNQLFGGSLVISVLTFFLFNFLLGFWISFSLVFSVLLFFAILIVVAKFKERTSSLPETRKEVNWADEFANLMKNDQSRRIFLFLLANLTFTFIELFFGWWTNSLGLISDAFHMLFDSFATAVSLWSTLLQQWNPDETFTYGYSRIQILSGFVNSLFLCFISFSIFVASIKRFIWPTVIHTDRLFYVAILGFLINILGLYSFKDAHNHNHHHHTHNHGNHSGHQHQKHYCSQIHQHTAQCSHPHNSNQQLYGAQQQNSASVGGMEDITSAMLAIGEKTNHFQQQTFYPSSPQHQSRPNNSNQPQRNDAEDENMKVLFLHILADALGSVSVIVSTILVWLFDWYRADSICSFVVSLLIFFSIYPSFISTGQMLLQRLPKELERSYDDAFTQIRQLDGVISCEKVHFWSQVGGTVVGSVHINITPFGNEGGVLRSAAAILECAGVSQATIQINKESQIAY